MIATSPATRRTALALALAFVLLYLITGGGRIVGSDEVTMSELSRALLRGGIAVPEGATLPGPDGRFYTKNTAGQAVLAIPWTLAGEAAARVLPFGAEKRLLVARAVVSTFNAFVTAILIGVFYLAARGLGAGAGAALAATLLLGLTTPLWGYSKSFMAEPLQSLGLLLALWGSARAASAEPHLRDRAGERLAALGVFLAVSAKLSQLPLALACLVPLLRSPLRRALWPLAALALALAGHAAYNAARFGTPLESGYGAQASVSAYSTPIRVGLYGLLISSGKGVLWFAPALCLLPWGIAAMRRARAHGTGVPARREAAARAALGILAAWAAALLLFGKFEHWAGDGSFGPRYLTSGLALGMLAVAFALSHASRIRRRIAWGLAALGLFVQLGGVSIYFGAQMREAGDYPYTLSLSDPRFMSDSHFNPRFTPILGHWRMLVRNAGEHLNGDLPRTGTGGTPDPRLGISAEDQAALLHALDFWWLYALYAGLPAAPLFGLLGALLAGLGFAVARVRAAWREEARAG
ncbi:MAG: hypothetical protein ABIS67_02365 [Candidatus Eisenbacteria bacterium]